MNMNFRFALSVLVTCTICSCDNLDINYDDVKGNDYCRYLYLDFSKTNSNLSQSEKEIFLKASGRIIENADIINGKYNMSNLSPESLNMDKDLFDFWTTLLGGSTVNDNYLSKIPHTKTTLDWDEYSFGVGPIADKDLVFLAIVGAGSSKIDTDFEKDCFYRYWYGGGNTYCLTSNEWNSLKSTMSGMGVNGCSEEKEVNFYGVSEYDYAFGWGIVSFNIDGEYKGFKDTYDFNWFPTREDNVAQIVTIGISIAGTVYGAKGYKIYGGTYAGL